MYCENWCFMDAFKNRWRKMESKLVETNAKTILTNKSFNFAFVQIIQKTVKMNILTSKIVYTKVDYHHHYLLFTHDITLIRFYYVVAWLFIRDLIILLQLYDSSNMYELSYSCGKPLVISKASNEQLNLKFQKFNLMYFGHPTMF